MTSLESIQKKLLAKQGLYNIAPLWSKYEHLSGKWCYIKDNKIHIIDSDLYEEERGRSMPTGTLLLSLIDDGYHMCTPSTKDKSSVYPIKDSKYFFIWDDSSYLRLSFFLQNENVNHNLMFEFVETNDYFAILFHSNNKKKGIISLAEYNWNLDYIVSKNKDLVEKGVFTYFHGDFIVVYDGSETIVYNNNFDIIYTREDTVYIWEVEEKIYLIFLCDKVVYDLCENEEINITSNEQYEWEYAWAYKNYIIFYNHEYCEVDYSYDEDDWYIGDFLDDDPVRNTFGQIYDSAFNLMREFNAWGEITEFKEVGDAIVMKTTVQRDNGIPVDAYYNIQTPNISQHNIQLDEDFSIPDISFSFLECSNLMDELYVVKTRVSSTDTIDFENGTNKNYSAEKCGIYRRNKKGKEEYTKVIDCKYDYIVPLSLNKDENIYYAGINGKGQYGKFDLYINNELKFKEYPFNKNEDYLRVVGNHHFIKYRDKQCNVGFIRNGDIVLEPSYSAVSLYIKRTYDYLHNELKQQLEYLFVVSDGDSYGICSPKGKLILPLAYSLIDIDEDLNIILEHRDSGSIEVGYYDEETESIKHDEANMGEDGVIHLDDDYIWDGSFRYLGENEHSGWTDQELRDAADIAYEGNSRLSLGLED